MNETYVVINGRTIKLTNLEKLMWPEGLTKAHLVEYYSVMAPYVLPYLHNRPLVMKRYPDGLDGEAFYQKECPEYAPAWIMRKPVEHSSKVVHYIICNNKATLVWLANQACIEMHAWLAGMQNLETPDLVVMDLDPAAGAAFADTLEIALLVRCALAEYGLQSFPKTSGANGVHLFIPVIPKYSWRQVTDAMKYIAELVENICPHKATTERKVAKRKAKVYLDYLQNGRGKTMAFPYSLRPLSGVPVSTPLYWWEVEKGDVRPGDFTMENIYQRIESLGDAFAGLLGLRQHLDKLINAGTKKLLPERRKFLL